MKWWWPSMLLAACSREPVRAPASTQVPTVPAPEQAVVVNDSTSVWFTSGRRDSSSNGARCFERLLEIRRGPHVVPVPLLYTGESPVVVNDSTVQVHIWLGCIPTDPYRVNLRTGQPTRVPQ